TAGTHQCRGRRCRPIGSTRRQSPRRFAASMPRTARAGSRKEFLSSSSLKHSAVRVEPALGRLPYIVPVHDGFASVAAQTAGLFGLLKETGQRGHELLLVILLYQPPVDAVFDNDVGRAH